MAADDSVTIAMAETVSYEITLTHKGITDLLDVTISDVAALLADVDKWNVTGPIKDNYTLLDEIDTDTYRAGGEDRTWSVRPATATAPLSPVPPATTPVITHPAKNTDESTGSNGRVAQMTRQRRPIVDLVTAYGGNTYRLLSDLGDHVGLSLAYVDRLTVEAHLERTLSEAEWAAINEKFTALEFDEHVGDHGSFRTDWIETVLEQASIPGFGYTSEGEIDARHHPMGGHLQQRVERDQPTLSRVADMATAAGSVPVLQADAFFTGRAIGGARLLRLSTADVAEWATYDLGPLMCECGAITLSGIAGGDGWSVPHA